MEAIQFGEPQVLSANDVEVVSGGHLKFNYLKNNPPALPTGPDVDISSEPAKKRAYNRKKESLAGSTEIIKDGEVVEDSTLETYSDNMNLLRQTIGQIDSLSIDIKEDFDAIRSSKLIKGKYQYSSMLSKNLTELLAAKITAIKELNTTIKNSNDLDYRKAKDRADAMAQNDDQAIMNMYNAFLSAPVSQGMAGRSALGPSTMDMTVAGASSIVGIDGVSGANAVAVSDPGYANYLNNLTPEQNLMRYENNPNVQEVVVYDAATGDRHFDIIDTSTGQSIPNVPRKDDMFLKDTTIDPIKKVARNINLNESYKVIVLNEKNGLNEY